MNRPIPTHLKLLAGNPGKRPLNPNEPKPKVHIPPCPSRVTGEGRREWRRRAKLFARLGILTEIDTEAFTLLCEAWGRYCEMEAKVKELGPILKEGEKFKFNPYILLRDRAFHDVRMMLSEFGISPSSRARVSATRTGTATELDDLLD